MSRWQMKKNVALFVLIALCCSCSRAPDTIADIPAPTLEDSAINAVFRGNINLNSLYDYANQPVPDYIHKDNTGFNFITDKGATLGRVLFYDRSLSVNNTTACASCHKQEFGFGDTSIASLGANGRTGRHAMRLINARFAEETRFFWNERAANLEDQTSMPIQDHNEMGYSGQNGDQSITDLIAKLNTISYYRELFKFVYGSEEITALKMQYALAQFIRSIQSFDSKYDAGRAQTTGDGEPFPNFTVQENQGKNLFMTVPVFGIKSERLGGGLGCAQCHRAPEFDIDPKTGNNGITGSFTGDRDQDVTRAPSLRDLLRPDGLPNGPMMHTGEFSDIRAAVSHYTTILIGTNTRLDARLMPNGKGQQLRMTGQELNNVIAFLKTLSGNNIYVDRKWSNPFP